MLQKVLSILRNLFSFKCIMLIRLLCGNYYEFYLSRIGQIAIKLYCVSVGTLNTLLMCSNLVDSNAIVNTLILMQSINVIFAILFIGKRYNIFYNELINNEILKVLNIKMFLPITGTIIFVETITTTMINLYYYNASCEGQTLSCSLTLSNITVSWFVIARYLTWVGTAAVLEVVWIHLRALRKLVEAVPMCPRDIRGVTQCLLIYKTLIDISDRIKTASKIMVLNNMGFCVLSFIFFAYFNLIQRTFLLHWAILLVNDCINFNLPAVFGVLIDSEIAKIQLSLLKKSTFCQGIDCVAIESVQKYIAARPFKLSILRLVDVDASMIIISFGNMTTLFIVVSQFMHIFD